MAQSTGKVNRFIECKTGIYDTYFTLTCHRNGSVTVKSPSIKWEHNSGCLNFCRTTIQAGKRAEMVKHFFAIDEMVDENQNVLMDILAGY
jgi:hypothetical protein